MPDVICSIPGCDRKVVNIRGWCQSHYKRWRAHGDPQAGPPIRRRRQDGLSLEDTFRHWMVGDPPPAGTVWLWSGLLDHHGYGYFRFGGRLVRAHRAAYEIFRERIPTGLVVRHNNDTPRDVNPWNMVLGTQSENMADMAVRERSSRTPKIYGEDHPGTHLSGDDVIEIRRAHASGQSTQTALATRYGVTVQSIWLIVHRKNWKHI